MAISTSFYKNVYLLTQLLPPSEDFKKHFREGMFDKPNTTGFVHVSHYLLSIYDVERFKKVIQWPVVCKRTETKYRNDVKEYLTVVANENTDIGFPPILASYLLHASGKKFTTIMWKLSEVALRTYITRETKQPVLLAPKYGPVEDTARKLLRNATEELKTNIINQHESFIRTAEATKAAAEEKMEELSDMKTKYMEKKQALTSLANEAPVLSEVKKCLTNVEDTEIIKLWQASIQDNLNYIHKRHAVLKDIENLSSKVANTVNNKINNTIVLDGKQLTKVNTTVMEESAFPPEVQVLLIHIYKEGKLDIYNFIQLFALLLREVHKHLKKSEVPDLSQCQLQVEAGCQDMKIALDLVQQILEDTKTDLDKMQNVVSQKKLRDMLYENGVPNVDDVLFLPSPPIKINSNSNPELQRRVEVTPVQGLYKSLFRRHERQTGDSPLQLPQLKSSLPVSRINLDNTIATDRITSRPFFPLKVQRTNSEQGGKYSRLFSASLKKNNMKANYSVLSSPGASRANSTAISEISTAPELNLDVTTRNLFRLRENLSTPKTVGALKMEKNLSEKFVTDKDEVEAMLDKVCKPVIDELTEVELTAKSTTNLLKPKDKKRRISISDLVERYKSIRETSGVSKLECNDE